MMIVANLLVAAAVASAAPMPAIRDEFTAYCSKYGKSYEASEFEDRLTRYTKKKTEVDAHNLATPLFHKGMNQFSDLNEEEYSRYFGLNKGMLYDRRARAASAGTTNPPPSSPSKTVEVTDIPSAFDWTKKHAVTKPRNQGKCGSCWAFAGTAAIESALFLSSGKLDTLSVQAFVDCVPDPKKCGGTGGCEGATYDLLYAYANSTHGPVLDSSYPYTGKDGVCHIGAPVAKVGGWVDVQSNNATALKMALLKTPVSVGVAAMNWGDYMGGVYPSELCDADLDHAVLLVGWGTDPGLGPYWKIKNSWGADWGEDGYIRVQRNEKFCTVDKVPNDGLGCAGGPSEVTVCGACAIQFAPSYPVDVTLA